jgi:hypothetical protein
VVYCTANQSIRHGHMSWGFPLGDSRVSGQSGHIRYHPYLTSTGSAQISNLDLAKASESFTPTGTWQTTMNLIRVLTSCWMAIRFSMSISRLITMSRLRYLFRRTGMLGFEGNGTFQSLFFSLLHILELAMDWTLGYSSSKISCSP